MTVYTTRPDTLFGATFMVVAADAKLAGELVTDDQRPAYEAYLEEVRKASDIERLSTEREKTGVFLGRYAVNPVNGQQIPIWAADYVLADYGTGAIMAVPGPGPARLGLRRALRPADHPHRADARRLRRPRRTSAQGEAINSANDEISLNGMGVAEAKSAIIDWLEQQGTGKGAVNFRLRDWLLSRQRYWGAPDPDRALPDVRRGAGARRPAARRAARAARRRPDAAGASRRWPPRETGSTCDCPSCGGPAKRDSDTMDTFVDSSWYFLRYCSPHDDTAGRSTPTWSTRGVRATSTSAGWSTRCCTCCTPASSPWS